MEIGTLMLSGCSRRRYSRNAFRLGRPCFRNLPSALRRCRRWATQRPGSRVKWGSCPWPVGPWCGVCGGGRSRPASRSHTPLGSRAHTCTPQVSTNRLQGVGLTCANTPPAADAKWVLVCPQPPTAHLGSGGADEGVVGTRGFLEPTCPTPCKHAENAFFMAPLRSPCALSATVGRKRKPKGRGF